MRNWKLEKFDGTLLEIIEDCAAWLPSPWHLAATQQWLLDQLLESEDNPDILLPLRRYKAQPQRGSVYMLDGCHFLPVDNEPTTALFELVRVKGSKVLEGMTLLNLIDEGVLPVSWACDAPDEHNQAWRFGPAAAGFRNLGLKLAHIFDASQKSLCGETADGCLPRFFRTMNPINCFPFPGVKQVTFGGDMEGDVAENATVQNVLRGFMTEYLNNDAAVEAWIHYSDVHLTEQQLNSDWRAKAQKIRLTITQKASFVEETTVPAVRPAAWNKDTGTDEDFARQAAPKVNGAKNAVTLSQLAEGLAQWVAENPGTEIRLDGKPLTAPGNRTAWILFRVDHFTGDHRDWNGIYRFHGDTSIVAIREMLGADAWEDNVPYAPEVLAARVKDKLSPAWTRSKNRSLILSGHTKPDHFYCFQV